MYFEIEVLCYNNNNKLQFGCHPVAVVILYIYTKYEIAYYQIKSGGLHEKQVVTTWDVGNHLSICF